MNMPTTIKCSSSPWSETSAKDENYEDEFLLSDNLDGSDHHHISPTTPSGMPLIVDYISEATTYQDLEQQVAQLRGELQAQKDLVMQKDMLIQKLQSLKQTSALSLDSATEQMSADSYCCEDEQTAASTAHASTVRSCRSNNSALFSVDHALTSFAGWVFRESSLHQELGDFLQAYTGFLVSKGIPIDKLNLMAPNARPKQRSSPSSTAGTTFRSWTWQENEDIIPRDLTSSEADADPMMEFWPTSAPNDENADSSSQRFIRVRSNVRIKDYVALPLWTRSNRCQAGLAWSSKEVFSEDHVTFFKETHAALSTVLRSYLNEQKAEHMENHLDDEIKERTRELEAANEKLYKVNQRIQQQSGQQLKHFAMMSHELRTPLNGMIGLTSLLQNAVDDLTPEQAETVEMIANSGDLLLRVVNDVLDYSKLTLGMVEINKEATRVSPLLEQVVDGTRVKAQQRNINIKTYYAEDLPSYIITDGRRLQQILFNLLGNAIKFSRDDGTVELKVTKTNSIASQDNTSSRIRIMVKDYGKGIEKSHFTKIFEPFQQADAETERTHGGTGLGLAITSRLVKSLGGSITVDSEVGKWCVFSVDFDIDGRIESKNYEQESSEEDDDYDSDEDNYTSYDDETTEQTEGNSLHRELSSTSLQSLQSGQSLGLATIDEAGREMHETKTQAPRATSFSSLQLSQSSDLTTKDKQTSCKKHETKTQAAPATDTSEMDSFRVLVAEDNKINQTLLQRTLTRIGVKLIDIVGDGSIAIKKCDEVDYDLILMDMQMPEMDGIEATRLIRQECTTANSTTKIIFVTAHALRDYEAKAHEVGADGFLSKPYKFQSIKQIVETTLQEKNEKLNS